MSNESNNPCSELIIEPSREEREGREDYHKNLKHAQHKSCGEGRAVQVRLESIITAFTLKTVDGLIKKDKEISINKEQITQDNDITEFFYCEFCQKVIQYHEVEFVTATVE